jgi:hypothetical protein
MANLAPREVKATYAPSSIAIAFILKTSIYKLREYTL